MRLVLFPGVACRLYGPQETVPAVTAQTPFESRPRAYGVLWAEVRGIGRVTTERRPGWATRWRVVIKRGGVTYQIGRKLTKGGLEVPFSNFDDAQKTLYGIRVLLGQDMPIAQAIAQFLPSFVSGDLIENRMAEYLTHFRELVAQGKRSPSTLREIERYAKPEGKGSAGGFAYWYSRNSRDLTNGDVEDWHKWLGKRGISPKTQKLISNAFRAFMRRLRWRSEIDRVPEFPAIEVPEYAATFITLEQQAEILEAIPWERRGLFLCAATEALRLSELRALDLDDYQGGRLRVTKTIQGKGRNERIVNVTKNRSAEVREVWSPALLEWLDWRLEQSTPGERLRGEVALFPNPTALNRAKRWGHQPVEEEWKKACDAVWIDVSFQQGTRHCILTVLAGELPERMLQAFSRHKDAKSLGHYTKPRVTKATIRRITGADDERG